MPVLYIYAQRICLAHGVPLSASHCWLLREVSREVWIVVHHCASFSRGLLGLALVFPPPTFHIVTSTSTAARLLAATLLGGWRLLLGRWYLIGRTGACDPRCD